MNSPYISTKSEAALKETAQQAAVRALAEACDIYPEELLGHLGMGLVFTTDDDLGHWIYRV